DPARSGVGMALALTGHHGSGKTHSLRFLMSRFARLAEGPKPVLLYVKAEGPALIDLYRRIASQIGFEELKQLSLAFTAYAAGEEVSSQRAMESLRRSPQKVTELLDSYMVEQAKVEDRVARDIGRFGLRREMQAALSSLLSDDFALSQSAYRWLTGAETTG